MLRLLDIFFVLLHTTLIAFNLFGWVWRKTRKWNLITLLLTGSAWVFLGIFYGWGYCPLTDWHFKVLSRLGVKHLPSSYVQYLIHRITGIELNGLFADQLTLWIYLGVLVISLFVNFRDKVLKAS